MKYKSFYFEKFKGIQERLEFCFSKENNKPTCVIGNNESGKTTLLKGINLIGQLCEGLELTNGRLNSIRPKEPYFTGNVCLGALIETEKNKAYTDQFQDLLKELNLDNPINIMIDYIFEFDKSIHQKTICNIKIQEQNISSDKHSIIIDTIKKTAPEILYYDEFKFVVPEIIDFSGQNDSANNSYWQKVFDDLLKGDNPSASSFKDEVANWSEKNDGDTDAVNQRILSMKNYLKKCLGAWIKETRKDMDFEIISLGNKQYSLKINSGGSSYSLSERSKGFQWYFCFQILTKIRKNRHGTGFVFLLDEPASYIHIEPQIQILQTLEKLAKEKQISVVYSTHAPQMINPNNKESIYYIKNLCKEFEKTNIMLYNDSNAKEKVDITDISPILANLSFASIKEIAQQNSEKKNNLWSNFYVKTKDSATLALSNIKNINAIYSFLKMIGVINDS